MYTGSLGEASKGREAELLAAADKYSLLELKKQCEKVLSSIIFLLCWNSSSVIWFRMCHILTVKRCEKLNFFLNLLPRCCVKRCTQLQYCHCWLWLIDMRQQSSSPPVSRWICLCVRPFLLYLCRVKIIIWWAWSSFWLQVVVERSQEVVRQPGWRDVLKVPFPHLTSPLPYNV